MKKNKKVLVFGTFDLFHKGHEYFLKNARMSGSFLIVVVARDKTVKKIKKIFPMNNENKRLEAVEKSGLADEVILGNLGDKYLVIKKIVPDMICLGYDQQAFIDKLPDKLLAYGLGHVKIKKLKAYKPHVYKSSLLKEKSKAGDRKYLVHSAAS